MKKSGNKDILVNRIIRVINFGETDISATSDSSDGDDETALSFNTSRWMERTDHRELSRC